MRKRKKNFPILILSLVVFALVGCQKTLTKADMSDYVGFPEEHHFKTTNYNDVLNKIQNKESGIYLIAHPDNPSSLSYVQILEQFADEEDIDIIVIDQSDASYDSNIIEKAKSIEENLVTSDGMRHMFPKIYLVSQDNVNTIYPEFGGISISSRLLSDTEREATLQKIRSFWKK